MSGAPKVRSMNVADSEVRSVLGPAGNKTRSTVTRKPASKPLRKVEKTPELAVEEKRVPSPPVAASHPKLHSVHVPSVLRRQEQLLHSNLSPNASCSSDASSDSFASRASTGRITRTSSTASRRKLVASKPDKVVPDSVSVPPPDTLQGKKRCAWVTPNTEPCYIAFHDEEWGVPVHDDKTLFELLVLSGALAELTWPAILSKRHIFREVFLDFDPVAVSKLSDKKITAPGSTASCLLSELKLRAIIDNSRQICKIIDEFGSFDKYIWGFVNHKTIVNKFRYPRQVPVKTPKADVISKDLVRRGFRSVGPTVVYSFMQIAGIMNDHLITCFRFQECITIAAGIEVDGNKAKTEEKEAEDTMGSEITRAMDKLSILEG
ncbi:probable GMP synthase [glutamine-hydrolyzing] [Macadamia integrifolia]|uniref:probable GMP synthase [glutamine-hydrolyzing] n=1 Tax=Macadamia integrifolia TaxID=60698 RepID=UPI001C4F4F65|nr:probable GMP synthase [glutamine-hydrolyzing] [Macadamia integrifolia]